MHEKSKTTTAASDADMRFREFFEEQRAYYRAWEEEWDRKLASGCTSERDSDGGVNENHDFNSYNDRDRAKFA